MRGVFTTLAATLACQPALVACGRSGEQSALEGSVTELLDLGYASARLEASEQDFALSFLKPRGEGEDVVLKLGVSTAGITPADGTTLDLAEALTETQQRGVFTRNVLDDPRQTFPRLKRGFVTLRTWPTPGARVVGELSALFENGVELASGRTIFGGFEANVP